MSGEGPALGPATLRGSKRHRLFIWIHRWNTLMKQDVARWREIIKKLGNVSFPISCKGEQAKFDRAITLMHNFFYPETSKAFQEIIRDDPDCGIAYWGLATSYRPNPLVPPFPVAIFYALSLLETIDLSDKTGGNQLKAARILNAQAKDHPKHPGSPII
jgi:hypothetical protein